MRTPKILFRKRLALFRESHGAVPCWDWPGRVDAKGYGFTTTHDGEGRRMDGRVYALAYRLLIGPVPKGLELDHLCRNRRCMNPWHLEPVTHAENVRRGAMARPRAVACRRGHAFTPENTGVDHLDKRFCRECKKAVYRRYHARRRGA